MAVMTVALPRPHDGQRQVIRESRRFNAVACGRRWGKSTLGVDRIAPVVLSGKHAGWFAPSHKNLLETWRELRQVLRPVTARANATDHRIDLVTGGVLEMWSLEEPDTARGRKYARIVIDEAAQIGVLQDAWELVLRSTLADYAGDAWFMSTPRGFNFFHALFERGQDPGQPEWASWQMPTHTNPHIRPSELAALERELPPRVYRQEIQALFEADVEGALWARAWLENGRVVRVPQGVDLTRVVVGVDPAASSTGAETGIVVAARGSDGHGYVLADASRRGSPDEWARAAVAAYHTHRADRIVAEANQGGEMVRQTLQTVDPQVPITLVHASRGKQTRAEPIAALYEQQRVHHVGTFPHLEDQYTSWVPGDASPDRLDAAVWALTELLLPEDDGVLPGVLAMGRTRGWMAKG